MELDKLSAKCSGWDEAKIRAEISYIMGEWSPYMDVRINWKGGKRIEWQYHFTCSKCILKAGPQIGDPVHGSVTFR